MTSDVKRRQSATLYVKSEQDRARTRSDTDSDDVDALSTRSHRFIPRPRRVVRVPISQNYEVVRRVGPVSVARLEHRVCRKTVKK